MARLDELAAKLEVAMGERAAEGTIAGSRKPSRLEPKRLDDALGQLVAPRAARRVLDHEAGEGVVRVAVRVPRARLEHRRLRRREIEQLRNLPDTARVEPGRRVDLRRIPLRQPTAVAEQHPEGDVASGRETPHHGGGQQLGQRAVQSKMAALGELQDPGRDERLDHAPRAKPVSGIDRDIGGKAAKAAGRGEAATARGFDVKDRAGDRVSRHPQRSIERLLQPLRERRVELRARNRGRRHRTGRRDGGPAKQGSEECARRSGEHRPAVDHTVEGCEGRRLELIVRHGCSFR